MSRRRHAEQWSASGPQPEHRPQGRRAWLVGRVVGIGIPVGAAVALLGLATYLALTGDFTVDSDLRVGGCLSDDTLDVQAVACSDPTAGERIVGIVHDSRMGAISGTACAAFPESRAVWNGDQAAALGQTGEVLCVVELAGE